MVSDSSRGGLLNQTHLSKLEHTKGLSKSKTSNNISSHEGPPLEQIGSVLFGVGLDLLNRETALVLDDTLPVLAKVRLAETTGEESATSSVFLWVAHGEDAQAGKVGKLLIPDVLDELGGDGVDLLEGFWVRDGDFCR